MGNLKESGFSRGDANLLWKTIATTHGDSNSNGNGTSSRSSGSNYSSNGHSSNGHNSNGYNSNNGYHHSNNNNKKRENKVVIVSNLNPLTKPETIHDVFSRYGHLYSVDLNTDENDEFDGSANIKFSNMPRDFDINMPFRIDGRAVTMKYGATLSEEQRPTYCNAKRLSLGIMLTPTEFVEEWFSDVDVKLSVFYDNRQLKAEFRHLNTIYILEIKFKDITNDVVVENIGTATYLTIPLKQPAMFSYYDPKAKTFSTAKSTRPLSSRANKIPLYPPQTTDATSSLPTGSPTPSSSPGKLSPTPSGSPSKSPIFLNTDENHLRLETWTVYRIKFDGNQGSRHQVIKLLNAMADYNLVPRQHQKLTRTLTVTAACTLDPPMNHQERAKLLDFDVLYMLECCITQNYLLERNLCEGFYKKLVRVGPELACGILEVVAQDKKRVWNPWATLESIWDKFGMKLKNPRIIPDHCSMLRKLVVTPTAIYVQAPTLESTNRVVRYFGEYADRFIRIQFSDEDLMKISPSFETKNKENIYDRVYQTLTGGIMIGNRRYEYLGFSSSQLREHGCWYFAPYDENDYVRDKPHLPVMNANLIRSWMGDFSDIKNVAKHAARIGLCFSTTKPSIILEEDQVERIDDIIHNGYTFSDGVGNISYELAAQVAKKMSIRVVPSAFQFRLAGAKGVLMVSDKLNGAKVQLRPSQIKFNSDHYMVEIIRTSTHISAYLNRQAITLLSSLGVKDDVFIHKLQEILHDLGDILGHSENAIKLLQSNADEFGISRRMASIIGAGYLDRQDPFIKNLLNMFRVVMLKNLKEKAKIPIKKGAFLFGVVDETGTLKANEVFCQVSNEATQTLHTVIKGKCVVFRNPCFHPGDIRVVTAADYPNLHHLKDVLVFPSVGYRDLPSMCSGGDLDGDDYTILWDEMLMPAIVNQPPMDYTPTKPAVKPRVKTRDIQKFFVNYMNNDNLGQIANAHLATADDSDKGAMDGRCKRLAQLHSSAVDFPKTGFPAKLQEDLKVFKFPDFMSKEDKPMYKSMKVLGQLFRQIDQADYDGYEAKLVDETVYDSRLQVPDMERYIGKAREDRRSYNREVTSLMNQYGVKTEAEMISGFVITWLKRGNKKSEYEIQKQTADAVRTMQEMFHKKFMEEFVGDNNNSNSNNDLHLMEAKAAAWYYVTYHPAERARDPSVEGHYFSFPWVMVDILVNMGHRSLHRQQTDTIPAVDEALIQKYQNIGNDEDFLVTVLDPDDNSDDGDDDGGDNNDDLLPIINKRRDSKRNGDDNDSLVHGDLITLTGDGQQCGENDEDDDGGGDNGDEYDDDDDDEEEEDDDDDSNNIISLDEVIKGYQRTMESVTDKTSVLKAMVPSNRDHQSTINADATEEDLASALL